MGDKLQKMSVISLRNPFNGEDTTLKFSILLLLGLKKNTKKKVIIMSSY